MKLRKLGQLGLAMVVSLGLSLGLTSCQWDYTVGFLYVTGAQYNQVGGFKVSNLTGNLLPIRGLPTGSGGTAPIRALVAPGGRFLYVLNQGTTTRGANGNVVTNSQSNISVFAIGGNGVIAFQSSYTSQGKYPIRMAVDSSSRYLYVLDSYGPTASGDITSPTPTADMPCQDADGYHPRAEISAFAIDNGTGRLSLITNQQQQQADGKQLPYFPVGCFPIDFYTNSTYIWTADKGTAATADQNTLFVYALNTTSGQLTTTQNAPLQTGATSISTINGGSSYVYILDPATNRILPFTVGSGGALQSQTNGPVLNSATAAGNPQRLLVDAKGKFLYIANLGPSGIITNPSSDISGYTIDSNGTLAPLAQSPFNIGTGSAPQCIVQDPTVQYIYTANYNDSTVTGRVYDPNSGNLTTMRRGTQFNTVGNPTWCVMSGRTY